MLTQKSFTPADWQPVEPPLVGVLTPEQSASVLHVPVTPLNEHDNGPVGGFGVGLGVAAGDGVGDGPLDVAQHFTSAAGYF